MSATIVQRIRQVVAAEDDDFFNAETILYYANKAKKKVASYMVQREREAKASLRALDGLRKQTNIASLTGVAKGGYFQADVAFPSDLLEVMHLRYEDRTILRELTSSKLYLLEWGNLVPTVYEGYYYITNDTGRTFRVYLHENPTAQDAVNLFYAAEPSGLTLSSTELGDMPEHVENAVIYGAAVMMIGQESVRDPNGNAQIIAEVYKEELQSSAY
jgi:hypothetical protein